MTFLNKLFGRGKKDEAKLEGSHAALQQILEEIISLSGLELTFTIREENSEGDLLVEFEGADEEMLTAREGQLLDAFQLYLKRVVQHQEPESRINVNVDCAGFRQQANDALIELADKLKDIALTKGKSVYFRALAPKDRKVVHQYLAEDGRVKSRSIGDGHFKKIKIYPVKGADDAQAEPNFNV
ncbi:MAG: protein jag [Bdellovibrionales bacterium]